MSSAKRFLLILQTLFSVVFSVLIPTVGHAHSPHDVVESVAVSPDFENDQTAFIYVFDELKRSTDGGFTWEVLENGLDNTSSLISDLATSPGNTGHYTIYAATRGDGIYRSRNHGDNWMAVNSGLSSQDIEQLVLSPDFDDDHTLVAVSRTNSLFISTNAGNSWQKIVEDKKDVTSATIIKNDKQTRILIGTSKGDFFLSDEMFEHWSKQGSIEKAGIITDISAVVKDGHDKAIFIGTSLNGLYKSLDLGNSFIPINMPPALKNKENSKYITSISAIENQSGSSDIFVTKWHEAVFHSQDGGASWEKLDKGLRKDKQADEFENPHFYRIAVTPTFSSQGDAFIGGFAGLYKTTDAGQTWIEMETRPARNVEGLVLSPAFPNDQTLALATYDGGAYLSDDAGFSWHSHNAGLPSTHLWDISFGKRKNNTLTMYAASNPAFLTSNGRLSPWFLNPLATTEYWKYITAYFKADSTVAKVAWRVLGNPGSPFLTRLCLSPDFSSDNTIFVGTRYKGVLKSVDGGDTWTHPWDADNGWISSIEISPNFKKDNLVFAAVRTQGFYVSTDKGESWHLNNTGLSPLAINYELLGSSVIAASPDFEHDRRVYFGTADGLYMSTNNGGKWERLQVSGDNSKELIRGIGLSPNFHIDGTILVGIKGKGLFKSTDKGNRFFELAPGLIRDQKVLKQFLFSPDYASDQTIFAASAEEVFVSHDSGSSWSKLERPVRYEDTKDNIIYKGAWQRIYSATAGAMNIHRSDTSGDQIIFRFVGNKVTWYGPTSKEYGTAKVYLDGRLAASVSQYSENELNYKAIFSIDNLPPGMHTLTIEVDNESTGSMQGRYIAIDALEVS